MRRLWILSLIFLWGCGGPVEKLNPTVVATWKNGDIALDRIESALPEARTPACIQARRSPGGGSIDQLLPCYREIAEDLALESLTIEAVDNIDAEIAQMENYGALRRQAYTNVFYRWLRDEIEVSDSEIEEFFAANQDLYRRPGRRTVWNIFRRFEDQESPEKTIAFLNDLRDRYNGGETFGELARQYSHSETRLRDGLVGTIDEGRLPKRLEEIAFALDPGEVSEPVAVRGGAILLLVTEVMEGAVFGLEDVKEQIRRKIQTDKVQAEVAKRTEGRQPPSGSVVLSNDELMEALNGEDSQKTVFEIGEERLTVAEFIAAAGHLDENKEIDLAEHADHLLEIYKRKKESHLLFLDTLETLEAKERQEADELLRKAAISHFVEMKLKSEMQRFVDDSPEKIRQFFEDNRPHYQSSLRFKIHIWDLPFGNDPPRQALQMEEIRKSLLAGETSLKAAAGKLGGTIQNLGWRDFDQLATELSGKARTYLLQVEDSGVSVPYQEEEANHLIWVEERSEPQMLEFEDVAESVRDDYIERFEEDIYRRVAEKRLDEGGFVYREEALRKLLTDDSG